MESNQLEIAKLQDEVMYFDLDNVLDILFTNKNKHYNIIFFDGEIWWNAKLYKKTINKFVKLKEKRGQKDGKV